MIGLKTFPILAIAVALVFGAVLAQSSPAQESVDVVNTKQPQKVYVLRANGMTCGSCEARIKNALQSSKNVGRVAVDIPKGLVAVEAVDSPVTAGILSSAVTGAGYPATHVGFMASFPREGGSSNVQNAKAGCGGGCCSPG